MSPLCCILDGEWIEHVLYDNLIEAQIGRFIDSPEHYGLMVRFCDSPVSVVHR